MTSLQEKQDQLTRIKDSLYDAFLQLAVMVANETAGTVQELMLADDGQLKDMLCAYVDTRLTDLYHPTILMQLLHPDAKLPQRQHPCDAGADICSIEDYDLQPGERHAIGTGLAMELPDEYVAYICPRSGLAIKHGIMITNAPATIDANFRGELKVILQNTGAEPFHISKGDRIAQLEIVPIAYASFARTGHVQDHPDSRDNGKFGSTGIK